MSAPKTLVPSKELIAICVLQHYASGDYHSIYDWLLEEGYSEPEIKKMLDQYGDQIDTLSDVLVEVVAKKVKLL